MIKSGLVSPSASSFLYFLSLELLTFGSILMILAAIMNLVNGGDSDTKCLDKIFHNIVKHMQKEYMLLNSTSGCINTDIQVWAGKKFISDVRSDTTADVLF